MRSITFFLMLVLSLQLNGCALQVEPIQVEGEVRHVVSIDAAQVAEYYKSVCSQQYGTQEEIDACTTESLGQFWAAVNRATVVEETETTEGME